MTELELITQRWDRLQSARLGETDDVLKDIPQAQQLSAVQLMNEDPFWEHCFGLLEKAIREIDPNHSYLPENNIQ